MYQKIQKIINDLELRGHSEKTIKNMICTMNSLQDIIKLHGESYTKSKKLPSNILKALYSIKDCSTATLGGHVYECDECGDTMISYNSCRNRHCPKCQTYAKEL